MISANRAPGRPTRRLGWSALALSAGLLLAGCGGDANAEAEGHDHAGGEPPATVEGSTSPYQGLYCATRTRSRRSR